jgi:murein L,D-transpeptidase YafK
MERARWAHELAGGAHGESEKLVARLLDPAEARAWKEWVAEALALTRADGSYALVVDKNAHQAVLYQAGKPHRRFEVDLGYNSLNQKLSAGDGATPEGRYRVVGKKDRGQSRYYKALLLDYPNGDDLKRHRQARRDGRVSGTAHPGGAIEIHGDGGRGKDWTEGCVALSNRDLDYAFARLSLGSPVVIVGSLAEASPADRP